MLVSVSKYLNFMKQNHAASSDMVLLGPISNETLKHRRITTNKNQITVSSRTGSDIKSKVQIFSHPDQYSAASKTVRAPQLQSSMLGTRFTSKHNRQT